MSLHSNNTSENQDTIPEEPLLRGNFISLLRRNFFSDIQRDQRENSRRLNLSYWNNTALSNRNTVPNRDSDEEDQSIEEDDNENDIIPYNSNDDFPNTQNTNEEYIDFRLYPIHINWKEVENEELNYYDIYDMYGCFGIAMFTLLTNVSYLKIEDNDFIYSVSNYFYSLMNSKNYMLLKGLMDNFPKLKSIIVILSKKMITHKEIVVMKLVLDIYERYIFNVEKEYIDIKDIKDYIKAASLFYEKDLKEEEIKYIYDIITEKMKKTFKVLKKLKCAIFSKRSEYIDHIRKLYKRYICLGKGLNKEMFIM